MRLLSMTVRTALRALRRNKLRAALTMLGIVIGVAAVIAMVSIGQGAASAVKQQIESLGTNVLNVVPGATTAGGVRSGAGGKSTLTTADARAISAECPAVTGVSYVKRQVVQVVSGDLNWSTMLQGTTPSYSAVRGWNVVSGTFFTDADERGATRVAALGQTVVDHLFGAGEDPIGAQIRIKGVPFQVLGVLERKGQTAWGQDQDDVIIVPFSTAERRVVGAEILGTVNMIFASVRAPADLEMATDQITELLRDRHRTPPGQDDDFTVRNPSDMARAAETTSAVMTSLLLAVASISLLVGGIGIMNILLVSVTERTREIGVRMAVGAKRRHILLQFLVEATTLSIAGGVVGAILGVLAARIVTQVANWPTRVSPLAIVGSLLFAGAVGVFFGYYPARKASRLEPVEALRYE